MKIDTSIYAEAQNQRNMKILAEAMENLYLSLKECEFQPEHAQALVESAFKGVVSE